MREGEDGVEQLEQVRVSSRRSHDELSDADADDREVAQPLCGLNYKVNGLHYFTGSDGKSGPGFPVTGKARPLSLPPLVRGKTSSLSLIRLGSPILFLRSAGSGPVHIPQMAEENLVRLRVVSVV